MTAETAMLERLERTAALGFPVRVQPEELAAIIAALRQARKDSARVDWLEMEANREPLLLHDGAHPVDGVRGLGLRPGRLVRTLREAIDTCRGSA